MKNLLLFFIAILFTFSQLHAQQITNIMGEYQSETCTFDSLMFTISATSDEVPSYVYQIRLIDQQTNQIFTVYEGGQSNGLSSTGKRNHKIKGFSIEGKPWVKQGSEYQLAIYVPEFDKMLVKSEITFTYNCLTNSVHSINELKGTLVKNAHKSYTITSQQSQNFNLVVYSLSGQQMLQLNTPTNVPFSLNALSKGVYLIRIQNNDEGTSKAVKLYID